MGPTLNFSATSDEINFCYDLRLVDKILPREIIEIIEYILFSIQKKVFLVLVQYINSFFLDNSFPSNDTVKSVT